MLSSEATIQASLTPTDQISATLSGGGSISATITADSSTGGSASTEIHLEARLSPSQRIGGALQGIGSLIGAITAGGCSDIETYKGDYEVIPRKSEDVVLDTSGKKMKRDVTVFKIPYWETSNESGKTAYIGVS